MGAPMNRFVRLNPRRGRSLWAAVAVGVVTIVALALLVTGVADAAEAVATLLVAPVFVVALYRGRTSGLITAFVAALVYAWFRLSDSDGAGAVGVAVLVLSRGGLYVLAAYTAPWLATRLPAVEAPALLRRRGVAAGPGALGDERLRARELDLAGWVDAAGGDMAPAEVPVLGHAGYGDEVPVPAHAGYGDEVPVPAHAGYGDEVEGEGEAEDELPMRPLWEEPLDPSLMTPPTGVTGLDAVPWDHPTAPEIVTGNGGSHGPEEDLPPVGLPQFDELAYDPDAAEYMAAAGGDEPEPPPYEHTVEHAPDLADRSPSFDPIGGPGGWEEPQAPPMVSFPEGPPAPTVPTGWVDDASAPQGDENIPVGFTGELFLPPDLRDAPAEPDLGVPEAPSSIPIGNGSPARQPGPGPMPPAAEPPVFDSPPGPVPPPPNRRVMTEPREPAPRPPRRRAPDPRAPQPAPVAAASSAAGNVDPETRLWNARFFRDRLTVERDQARQAGGCFSVVMIQVPDAPFQPLPYRRQVALLRELGHQFVQARLVDHLVHLPDGAQHWFAVVLGGTDRAGAHMIERRLRSAIGGYLRNRGLQVAEIQSASLTSPDDDEAMSAIWASLLGSRV